MMETVAKKTGYLSPESRPRRENLRADRIPQRDCPEMNTRDSIISSRPEIYGENNGNLPLLPAFVATVSNYAWFFISPLQLSPRRGEGDRFTAAHRNMIKAKGFRRGHLAPRGEIHHESAFRRNDTENKTVLRTASRRNETKNKTVLRTASENRHGKRRRWWLSTNAHNWLRFPARQCWNKKQDACLPAYRSLENKTERQTVSSARWEQGP